MTNIPSETKYFHYYNANPKNRKTGDCVIRAIATSLQQSWIDTLKELTEMSLKTGYSPLDVTLFDKYLNSKQYVKQKQLRKPDNTKYTGIEFAQYLNDHMDITQGNPVIVNIGSHHTSVFVFDATKSYRCWDIWDPTYYTVGNFWIDCK